jgi:hypothetical protein
VGVINFPVWPVYCHIDGNGENTITQWLDQNGVSSELRGALQAQIDLLQYCDPSVVPGLIVPISEDLEAFRGIRRGESPVYLIFQRGLFTDREITILSASHSRKESLAEARRNLGAIQRDRRRRRYEPITRKPTRNIQG